MLSEELIRKVRESNDIVDVIGSYLPLTQKGKNYFCVCPFHDDHSPSMSISKDKQIFKCFVCGTSGNSITFVKDYLNISFIEAVEILANNSHIDLKLNKIKADNPHKTEYEIYNLALSYYKNNLNTLDGAKAKEYLTNRKLSKDTIDYFDIGLSLNGGLSNSLSKKYDKNIIEKIGLSSNNKDLFTNRIMFTIRDNFGNVVGFSGRKYDDTDAPKYINTKETEIFKKGTILYNYYKAKNEIKKKHEVIISEGFMEVIRLHEIGIDNVVALMGTSFTKEHLEIIKKDKVEVVLNLDQDDAGVLATISIGRTLIENGINPTVIVFSNYKDADELIVNLGEEAFLKAYKNKVNFIDFELNYLKKNKDLNDAVDLSKYINESIELINKINDDILRELKIKELSEKYGLSIDLIKSKITNKKVIPKKEIKEIKKVKYNKYDVSEIRILYLMLNNPNLITYYENNLGYLNNPERKKLANAIINYKEEKKIFDYADFICYTYLREDLSEVMNEIQSYPHNDEYTMEEFEDYVTLVKRSRVDKQINSLVEKMKNTIDLEEKKKLATRIENMKKEVLKW